MRWVFAGGKRLPGLVKRRQWEADRFFEWRINDNEDILFDDNYDNKDNFLPTTATAVYGVPVSRK
jgi:hypothetical protein